MAAPAGEGVAEVGVTVHKHLCCAWSSSLPASAAGRSLTAQADTAWLLHCCAVLVGFATSQVLTSPCAAAKPLDCVHNELACKSARVFA